MVEMMVVIVIIGILVGLLLPAIQSAREAARSAQCKNNLKQLALGIHQFHDVRKRLPTHWGYDRNVWGTWFVHILPYVEQAAVFDDVQAGGGYFGSTGSVIASALPPQPPGCQPSTTTCTDPGKWECKPGPPELGVGHSHVGTVCGWNPRPSGCTTTPGDPPCASSGTGAQMEHAGYGIAAASDRVFQILQCPSDPYKDGEYHLRNLIYPGDAWSVTNYLANWHAFTDSTRPNYPNPWAPSIRLDEVRDGVSQTILFGEAYSRCEGHFRLAFWGDNRRHNEPKFPANLPYRGPYPSHNFGNNWLNQPNTYMFQSLPKRAGCNAYRIQGMHPGVAHVALMDGSVRSLRKNVARQEITHPDFEGAAIGLNPNPLNLQEATLSQLRLSVWDRLLLPRDGGDVQLHDGSN